MKIGELKKRTQKSLIQRYFPRFVEEEIKEIMTSIELADAGVNLDNVIKSLDNESLDKKEKEKHSEKMTNKK